MAKGKLHQLLAVTGDLKGTCEKILGEARDTFNKKANIFEGHSRTYSPLNQEDTERFDDDIKQITETVQNKLKYIQGAAIKHWDALLQQETANTLAKADLIVEDDNGNEETLAKDLPATALLQFETKLKELRAVYETTPTYDTSKVWKKSEGEEHVYTTDPVETIKSKKIEEVVILFQPTKDHPGQAKTTTVDKQQGKWKTIHKSAALSPLEKSIFLGRIDKLIQAVKKARQRANDQEVEPVKIGQQFFSYIHK